MSHFADISKITTFPPIDFGDRINVEINTLRELILQQWIDFKSLEEGVRTFLSELFEELKPKGSEMFLNSFRIYLDCKILNGVHDLILNRLHDQFVEEDRNIFTNCIKLCETNVSAAQMGANKDFSISLPAAIVELASLDIHATPVEKSACLSTAYDLIFAELKLAMAEEIASSQNENRIPVVETRDVIPILAYVIAKSKPKHFYSNLYYVQSFSTTINDDKDVWRIFETYQMATQCVIDLAITNSKSDELHSAWDLSVFSKIICKLDTNESSRNLRDNEIRRTAELISTSHENK